MSNKAESQFQKEVMKGFKQNFNSYSRPYIAQSTATTNGTPDTLHCVNGMYVAVELKVGNNQPTEAQEINLFQITRAGGIAILLYDQDGWQDTLKSFLQAAHLVERECIKDSLKLYYGKIKNNAIIEKIFNKEEGLCHQ